MLSVWSSDRFDRKLAALFEEFEGREAELQDSLNQAIKSMLDEGIGTILRAKRHPAGYTVPLIDNRVIVFSLGDPHQEVLGYVDISEVDHFNLLNIEREPR